MRRRRHLSTGALAPTWHRAPSYTGRKSHTREHRRHQYSRLSLHLVSRTYCKVFTRVNFPYLGFSMFTLVPHFALRCSGPRAPLISPVHECSHARFNIIFVVRVMLMSMFSVHMFKKCKQSTNQDIISIVHLELYLGHTR